MTTRTLFGVAGAVVGFYVTGGNPEGARWGFMIGSVVGGIVDPEVLKGPSLGDGQQQTSQAGVPRPIIYGIAAGRGNVIDRGELRKIKVREEQGKGGPIVESERFILTYAIRICEGPAHVRRVLKDGKLVYDISDMTQRPDTSGDKWTEYRIGRQTMNAKFLKTYRFYTGDETQLPDSALEAIHGVGETCAYRGTAYMAAVNDDVTERGGSVSDFLFEMASSATLTLSSNVLPSSTRPDTPFGHGYSTGPLSYAHYVPTPSDAAVVFRLHTFNITSVARIRVAALGAAPASSAAPATSVDRAIIDSGAVYDSGWYAPTEAKAAEFRAYEIAQGRTPPMVMVGLPGESVVYLDDKAGGFLCFADMYHSGYETASCSIDWPNYTGAVIFNSTPEVQGALLGSDGEMYWPAWVTPSDDRKLTVGMIPPADIVTDVAGMVGITSSQMDLTQLAGINVRGYQLARQMSAADAIKGLQLPYMFDMPEWDAKLRAVRRGGAIVATITDDDLIDSDDDQVVRHQTLEFPRRLTISAPDPSASHAIVTQTAQRRSTLVKAESEASIGLALTLLPDETAQIADTQLKILWANAEAEAEFRLPEEWTFLTPSDAVEYGGKRYRLDAVEYGDGEMVCTARYDRVSAYQSSAVGISVDATPAFLQLRGQTRLQVLNLPVLAETDDDIGVYLAVGGRLGAWNGAAVHLSDDRFQTWAEIASVTRGAVIGQTATALVAETGGFPSAQSLTVSLPSAPESLDYAGMLRYRNRAAIGGEVIQYEDVTDLGGGLYRLDGIIRGAYATDAIAHAIGTRFVLLDAAVLFVPIPRSKIGQSFQLRAVTSGTSPDAAPIYTFSFTTCVSQTEWPVHSVTAVRDISDQVTVSWIGRGRIGPETAPYNSRYFTGYRVSFSDGHVVETTATTITYAGAPGSGVPVGVTVTVCALNAITDAGPASTGITI